MGTIAVVAHSGKSLGGGLNELREELAVAGVANPLWFEVPKSKMAPKRVREALDNGAEIIFVWGGDGMVQRCVDAMAGSDAALAIVPAGTANLFASNLEIPKDVRAAVAVGLDGHRRRLDVGEINGERFVVMAGAGLDALMIRDADGTLKNRLGRAAYILTGAKNISRSARADSRAHRRREVVQRQGELRARRECRRGVRKGLRVPRRPARRRPARHRDRHRQGRCGNGREHWPAPPRAMRSASPFVETARGRKFDVRFADAAPLRARRRRSQEDEALADQGPSRSADGVRAGGDRREHRNGCSRDVGAHRRRRPPHAARLRAVAAS